MLGARRPRRRTGTGAEVGRERQTLPASRKRAASVFGTVLQQLVIFQCTYPPDRPGDRPPRVSVPFPDISTPRRARRRRRRRRWRRRRRRRRRKRRLTRSQPRRRPAAGPLGCRDGPHPPSFRIRARDVAPQAARAREVRTTRPPRPLVSPGGPFVAVAGSPSRPRRRGAATASRRCDYARPGGVVETRGANGRGQQERRSRSPRPFPPLLSPPPARDRRLQRLQGRRAKRQRLTADRCGGGGGGGGGGPGGSGGGGGCRPN